MLMEAATVMKTVAVAEIGTVSQCHRAIEAFGIITSLGEERGAYVVTVHSVCAAFAQAGSMGQRETANGLL